MYERHYACTSVISIGSPYPFGIYDMILDRVAPFPTAENRDDRLRDLRAGRATIDNLFWTSNEKFGLDPDWRDKTVEHPERVFTGPGKHAFMVDE